MADRRETFERVLAPEPGRTALVVVDMQRGFLDPGEAMEVPPAREIVPVIQGLLGVFRARRLPVVFTEFVYSPSAPVLIGSLHPEHRPRRRERRADSVCRRRPVWKAARAPRRCRIWSTGPASSSCASAATTPSPARSSTAPCGRGT